MDEFGMNENTAFAFIQRRAMSERVTMRDISQRIIDGDIKPDA
jgi:AmiR/NasT family two-component response regulator